MYAQVDGKATIFLLLKKREFLKKWEVRRWKSSESHPGELTCINPATGKHGFSLDKAVSLPKSQIVKVEQSLPGDFT